MTMEKCVSLTLIRKSHVSTVCEAQMMRRERTMKKEKGVARRERIKMKKENMNAWAWPGTGCKTKTTPRVEYMAALRRNFEPACEIGAAPDEADSRGVGSFDT